MLFCGNVALKNCVYIIIYIYLISKLEGTVTALKESTKKTLPLDDVLVLLRPLLFLLASGNCV